jgi:hypothetical protein
MAQRYLNLKVYRVENKHPDVCFILAESESEAADIACIDGFVKTKENAVVMDWTHWLRTPRDRFERLLVLAIGNGCKGVAHHESPCRMQVGHTSAGLVKTR